MGIEQITVIRMVERFSKPTFQIYAAKNTVTRVSLPSFNGGDPGITPGACRHLPALEQGHRPVFMETADCLPDCRAVTGQSDSVCSSDWRRLFQD
jgi:hypothetical protein